MRSKFKWIYALVIALTMQFSFAQQKTVTGTVKDSNGMALSGANVKNGSEGVATNADGKFAIKAKQGDELKISYQGMQSYTLTVGPSDNYNVKMTSKDNVLETVLVTGALNIRKKKEAITATTQVVSNQELTQAAAPNAIQSLAGKVSGLMINTVANGVDPTTKITLRGNRTLTGSNDALVVIDGVVSSASILGQLPPEVIESVNVIKGAQGAALYGAQGLNGVIMVTTKRGTKSGKMRVSFDTSIDFQTVSYMPKRQDKYGQGWEGDAFDSGDGNGDTSHIPWENGAWGPAFNDPIFAGTLQPTGLPQADGTFIMSPWESIKDNTKQFFKTGTLMQNGISLNVGDKDSYAVFSANRQQNNFVVEGDQLKRNSFIFKAGKKFGNFNIEGNVTYINSVSSQTSPDLFFELMQTASNIPVGRFNSGLNEHNWTVYYQSPYWKRDNIRFYDSSNLYNGVINLGYEFNKHVNVSYNGNIRLNQSESSSYENASHSTSYDYTNALVNAGYFYNGAQSYTYGSLGGHDTNSSFYSSQFSDRKYYGDLMFNFNYDLTKNWNLKFNIGNNIQDYIARNTQTGGTNLQVEGWYHVNNLINAALYPELSNYNTRTRVVGFFGNFDLAFKDYLFINLTERVESTSTLFFGGINGVNLQNVNMSDKKRDWYNYPSVGVSFLPLKAFDVKQNNFIETAKVYANWVSVSNSNGVAALINDYVGQIPSGFPFPNLSSYVFDTSGTSLAVGPETVNTKEIGGNFDFWKNHISLDAAFYVQDTKNLITRSTTSSASGITSLLSNIGDIRNKGFEIDLTLRPFTGDFKWDAKVGYTKFDTKVLALADGVNSINLQSNTFVGVFAEVGEDFPLIKGTKYIRDNAGNIVVDANGNARRTSTFEKLGKATPDYVLNFSNTFQYKGFSLRAVADYRTGHSIYSETKRNLSWSGHLIESADFDRSAGYVIPNSVQETSPGSGVFTPNTTPVGNNVGGGYAGVLSYYSGNFDRTGEAQVIDATAFRIREIALSYELPKKLFNNTGITGIKIGVNSRNPFTKFSSENKNYNDPEQTNTSGTAQGLASIGRYPITRTVGFNVNLTF